MAGLVEAEAAPRAGMYAPWFHLAYEKLQADLESFLNSPRYANLNIEKIHVRKHPFREWDLFRYDIIREGEKIGEVFYEWGAEDVIRSRAFQGHEGCDLFGDVDKIFANEHEIFQKYADEFRKQLKVRI